MLVYTLRCNIHCTLETKGHICSPQIIIDGLGQCYDIKAFFPQKIRCFVCAITTKNDKAVEITACNSSASWLLLCPDRSHPGHAYS